MATPAKRGKYLKLIVKYAQISAAMSNFGISDFIVQIYTRRNKCSYNG